MPRLRSVPPVSLHLPMLNGRMRLAGMIAGCVVAAGGIATTLQAGLGVGPYDVLNSGLALQLGITFGMANIMASTAACLVGRLLGAHIGPGTLVAMLGIGPLIDMWLWILPEMSMVALQVAALVGGLAAIGLGLSLLIATRLGPGPVEVLMLGLSGRGIPVRWVRTAIEIGFCVAGVLLGGEFGVGTIVIALAIGHVMAAFVPRQVV